MLPNTYQMALCPFLLESKTEPNGLIDRQHLLTRENANARSVPAFGLLIEFVKNGAMNRREKSG